MRMDLLKRHMGWDVVLVVEIKCDNAPVFLENTHKDSFIMMYNLTGKFDSPGKGTVTCRVLHVLLILGMILMLSLPFY